MEDDIVHPWSLVLTNVWFFVFVLITGISFLFPFAYGSSSNLTMYSVDSKPYGLSYGEWTAKWWQWLYSIQREVNPANDDTGKNCAQDQSGPVWFLAGSTS